ncbi:MAG: haloacid dehalogenase [Nitrospirae bacterium GWC2_46_6]|nr:MAG: haloacid dehalogenase [Nitrospirae bacterium GWC2_46_6]OGW21319.1 MAG: haloacid dehalogenase [Nitrospirae bacterium GWA2_46_11]OGW26100.1 MAG: haloacid dehalogenase [Nitrospirae bacterium GWB2_47_37]HAK89445.1 haloacid dehalogenase [Nitrospiraceae bacterium]HCL81460.1 haloacid dehalogenase [Nitrospiraceae bacterium]
MIPLNDIKFVLLDMDGTLLDKYFDDYFWEHLVPEKYAEKHHMTFGKAKEELLSKYKVHEGTLNWTDIDFWSKELHLDIPALKEQIKHLIEVHPHVEDFLKMLRRHKKKVYMVTNAHYKVLDIKLKKTEIGKYFDRCITSFEMGYPKEMLEFWNKTEKLLKFDRENTLFIDDTAEILKTAQNFGIKHLLLKTRANSKKHDKPVDGFRVLENFKELLTLS